ncbi:hypothetical protein AKJ16_DCAP19390, partial [Drosera capensis]
MLIELGGMMHFLLRSTQTAVDQPQAVTETYKETSTASKPVTTLQGLISEESSQSDYMPEDREEETQWFGIENG